MQPSRIVISASRRTDIPAFFMPWFMSAIQAGRFEVINPYNRQVTQVPADSRQVHSIVFWSKNFGPFLDQGYGKTLVKRGYRLFFNFTINSTHHVLEPMVPPLDKRLDQLAGLVDAFGAPAIQWRFDPICFFRDASGKTADNLDQFEIIARRASQLGVRICITSFVDLYRKVLRRVQNHSPLELIDPPMETKIATIEKLAGCLTDLNIGLKLCCEKDLLAFLPKALPVDASACIPSERLIALYGPGISLARDSGQRRAASCRCGVSKDIGSYHLHPCPNNCLFCYANPSLDTRTKPLKAI